ncbi:MAG: rod shape-determining protein [Bdellovibrionales bacterium]|nr:rod shape-determining protein [Bdellovibrionales bacterium]
MINKMKSVIRRNGFYIDLGTENTLIYGRGQGWVLNEPSFVTFNEKKNNRVLMALGRTSKSHLGRNPQNIKVERPLHEGVIADFFATESMLRGFFNSLNIGSSILKSDMIISLPCLVTQFERRAVEEVGQSLGAKKVHLLDEPMAAAVGSGLPVMAPRGQIIVDIGGGTTEIAIISLGGVAYSTAVRIGGHSMDQRIMQHLRHRFNILIGETTAEKLKINFADALNSDPFEMIKFNGIDLSTGLPRRIELSKSEISFAINPILDDIVASINVALASAEPELSADISEQGIWLAGGGALIKNFSKKIELSTGLKVNIARDPLFSVARGGAYLLEHPELLEKLAV